MNSDPSPAAALRLKPAQPFAHGKPVNSWNERDPLEQVIVGRLDGAVIRPYHVSVTFDVPGFTAKLHRLFAGRRYPDRMITRATNELDAFVRILECDRVRVRRPDIVDRRARFCISAWCSHCPRDGGPAVAPRCPYRTGAIAGDRASARRHARVALQKLRARRLQHE